MTTPHPMQPVAFDRSDVLRFKPNTIVEWLFNTGRLDLNAIAVQGFPVEDQEQLAQLLGYSVSGYGDLSYVTEESLAAAEALADEARRAADDTTPAPADPVAALEAELLEHGFISEEWRVTGMTYRSHSGAPRTESSGPFPADCRDMLPGLVESRGGRIQHRILAYTEWADE